MYPEINPIALNLGFIQIYWYGVMYLLSFVTAFILAKYRVKNLKNWDDKKIEDLIFYAALGVVLGGRAGDILFYQFGVFIEDPLILFKVWQGGMSFHGGFLGVFLAMALFSRKYKQSLFVTTDFAVLLVPLGLFFGRMGNFINSELWGVVTTSGFGMFIPKLQETRFPTQLLEGALEGLVLFVILWIYSSKVRPKMRVSALFLMGYGIFRIFAEFFRDPSIDWGYLAFGWVTMGQVLSVPMVLFGLFLWFKKQ
jgi:phosphatidylglycerol:prolipoprotein diacylglycerol transferase